MVFIIFQNTIHWETGKKRSCWRSQFKQSLVIIASISTFLSVFLNEKGLFSSRKETISYITS